jgi:DNA-binding NtrC family response regulator
MGKFALVVDNDLRILDLIHRWLTPQGYQIATRPDFAGARELLRTQECDLLIADVRLDEFNGLQLAIEARHAYPRIRIVVISGWTDVMVAREAEACKAVVLLKPFTAGDLDAAVEAAAV